MKWSSTRIKNEVKKIATEIDYPVPEVQVSDKMVKRFGKTDSVGKIVRLNKRFIELNSAEVVKALIVHELVHLKFPNHGEGFKREMLRLGYSKHVMKGFSVKMEKYRYDCEKCGTVYDNRKIRDGTCKKCGGDVVGKGIEIVLINNKN